MNPVFLVLLILLFLYFISILNNNNIEKFVNIQPMAFHNSETCTSNYQTYNSGSTNPEITGCESNYCSTTSKGGTYGPTIKICYAKGSAGTKCITENTCNSGLVCGRFNNDTSTDAAGATPKYCISTRGKCDYKSKNRANQCLQGKRCNDNNNCVNN